MALNKVTLKHIAQLLFIFLVSLSACKENNDSGDDSGKNNGPSAEVSMSVYQSVADSIIIPSYKDLQEDVDQMQADASAFTASPSTVTLETLKASYKEAYISLQYVLPYDGFGPADEEFSLDKTYNVHPVEEERIKINAEEGGYDLTARANSRAIGFPAIDYLLFGTETETVTYFEETPNAKQYLNDIIAQLKSAVDNTYNGWITTGDDYRSYFISNTGNSVSSSLGFLVNDVNLALEDVRNQIREPAGLESVQGSKYPKAVQAYYSGYSLELNKAGLHGIEMLYNGKTKSGESTQGLYTLLNAVDAEHNGNSLVEVTQEVFDQAQAAVEAIPESLAESIENDHPSVSSAVQKIQAVVPYYKADMSSALSVQITYQSGDGD